MLSELLYSSSMKIYIVVAIIVSLGVADGRIKHLPITRVGKSSKPVHGECFRNNGIVCTMAGAHIQYDGEDCVDCVCDSDLKGVTCCMMQPFPLVKHPMFCERLLDTTTCTYTFEWRKCRDACVIKGYETSDVDFKPEKPLPKAEKNVNV